MFVYESPHLAKRGELKKKKKRDNTLYSQAIIAFGFYVKSFLDFFIFYFLFLLSFFFLCIA